MAVEPAAASDADRLKKGQRQFMTGLALVMAGLIFGGGLAMVFYFLGQRESAIICAATGAVGVLIGIVMQMQGAKLLRSKSP